MFNSLGGNVLEGKHHGMQASSASPIEGGRSWGPTLMWNFFCLWGVSPRRLTLTQRKISISNIAGLLFSQPETQGQNSDHDWYSNSQRNTNKPKPRVNDFEQRRQQDAAPPATGRRPAGTHYLLFSLLLQVEVLETTKATSRIR